MFPRPSPIDRLLTTCFPSSLSSDVRILDDLRHWKFDPNREITLLNNGRGTRFLAFMERLLVSDQGSWLKASTLSLLLEKGADPHALTSDGKGALEVIPREMREAVRRALKWPESALPWETRCAPVLEPLDKPQTISEFILWAEEPSPFGARHRALADAPVVFAAVALAGQWAHNGWEGFSAGPKALAKARAGHLARLMAWGLKTLEPSWHLPLLAAFWSAAKERTNRERGEAFEPVVQEAIEQMQERGATLEDAFAALRQAPLGALAAPLLAQAIDAVASIKPVDHSALLLDLTSSLLALPQAPAYWRPGQWRPYLRSGPIGDLKEALTTWWGRQGVPSPEMADAWEKALGTERTASLWAMCIGAAPRRAAPPLPSDAAQWVAWTSQWAALRPACREGLAQDARCALRIGPPQDNSEAERVAKDQTPERAAAEAWVLELSLAEPAPRARARM